jgi:anti-sigma factor RsiW
MTCHDRDQDLALLVHDELHGLRRLLTQAHLRGCPRCQEKRAQYQSVSGLLASAIRGETMPPFRRRVPPPASPLPGLQHLSWQVAATLLLALAAAAAVGVMEVRDRLGILPPPNSTCAPGLAVPPRPIPDAISSGSGAGPRSTPAPCPLHGSAGPGSQSSCTCPSPAGLPHRHAPK